MTREGAALVAFDVLRCRLEQLAGDMVLRLADVAPDEFLERVLQKSGAIAIRCGYCRRVKDLIDGRGTTGFSDGICEKCVESVWKEARVSRTAQ